jgi:prephenate dehydrogenase
MPLAGVLETIELLKDDIAPGVIVTDTAFIKQPILQAAGAFKLGVHFIGGHPIFRPTLDAAAPRAQANAELFRDAQYCLTPTPDTDADALNVLAGFVSLLGAKPFYLDAVEHDGLAAGAQHLALVTQAVFLKTTTASSGWRELNKFAGDDYFQTTQLATQDAQSIAQLLLAQQAPLQLWMTQTMQTLREIQTLLAQNDASVLEKWLAPAQDARAQWLRNEVGAPTQTADLSEVRSSAARMFLGGLATRFGGDKNKDKG